MNPYAFEDNLQNIAFAGLTTRAMPHGTTRGNTELPADRIEVKASGFAQASPQMAQNANGAWFNNHYSGTLAWGVLTQRGGGNVANHNVWVANIRSMMSRPAGFFTLTNLPCYEILRVAETASDPEQVAATDTDRTDLAFEVELAIVGSSVA